MAETKDVIVTIKAKNEAGPAFQQLNRQVKDTSAAVQQMNQYVVSMQGVFAAETQKMASSARQAQTAVHGLASAVNSLGQAMGKLPFLKGLLGGGLAGGFAGVVGALGLAAVTQGPDIYRGILRRQAGIGGEPEDALAHTPGTMWIGHLFNARQELMNERRLAGLQGQISARDIMEQTRARIAGGGIAERGELQGYREQVAQFGNLAAQDVYTATKGPQYGRFIGRAAGFQLAGTEATRESRERDMARATTLRLEAQKRLQETVEKEPLMLEKRILLQQELIQRIKEEQDARIRVAQANRDVLRTQQEIVREQIHGAQMAFGSMTPGQQRGALELVRRGLTGVGAGISPGWRIGPGGRVERVMGQPGRFSPEELGVIGSISPALRERLVQQQAEGSPFWKELQGLLGGMMNQAGQQKLAIDFTNKIDLELKGQAEQMQKIFESELMPRLMQFVNLGMEKLKQSITDTLIRQENQQHAAAISKVGGGATH